MADVLSFGDKAKADAPLSTVANLVRKARRWARGLGCNFRRSKFMQMIEAVVKPHKLEAVKQALAKLGILGVTAVECKGFGRQMGHTERYRGAKMDVGFVPKVLLKICVKSEEAQQAVAAIVESARTGEVGDGKIFVYPVAQVVRIRTGETNEQAL
jgi:nitrogen regulatory protein PII